MQLLLVGGFGYEEILHLFSRFSNSLCHNICMKTNLGHDYFSQCS